MSSRFTYVGRSPPDGANHDRCALAMRLRCDATVSCRRSDGVCRDRWPTIWSSCCARCVWRRKYGDSVPCVFKSGAWMPTMNSPSSDVASSASAVIRSSAGDTPSQFGEPPTNASSSSVSVPRYLRRPSPAVRTTPTSHELSSMAIRWGPSSTM